jgi:hypothetical protein
MSDAKRLAVMVPAKTRASIELVMEREGITQTEAVRRLLSYAELYYRTVAIDGDELLIRRGNLTERVVMV